MWDNYSFILDDYKRNAEHLKKEYLKLKEKDEALSITKKKLSAKIKTLSVSVNIYIIELNCV